MNAVADMLLGYAATVNADAEAGQKEAETIIGLAFTFDRGSDELPDDVRAEIAKNGDELRHALHRMRVANMNREIALRTLSNVLWLHMPRDRAAGMPAGKD